MILASNIQTPSMQNNFNPNASNFQGIINTYFWLLAINYSTTLPTREVVSRIATTILKSNSYLIKEINTTSRTRKKKEKYMRGTKAFGLGRNPRVPTLLV